MVVWGRYMLVASLVCYRPPCADCPESPALFDETTLLISCVYIAGLGIGQTVVVAPVYLSEIAPKSIRGLCTCTFSGSVYLGIMLAYFASWGSQLHIKEGTSNQWVRSW